MANSLRILPLDQVSQSSLNAEREDFSFTSAHPNMFFTDSGKAAIRSVAEFHRLGREDEALVVTTSDSPFVSSCVTSTLFNFCKVSRVLTENTRLIFVIHEFGFPCERVKELAGIARDRGIPLVEDIAHSLTSSYEGQPLGTFGDYAIHSLPKSIPIENGGILLSKSSDVGMDLVQNETVKNEFVKHSSVLKWVHRRRRGLYEKFGSLISSHRIYGLPSGVNPFCFAYKHGVADVQNVYQMASRSKIELLRTHNPDWVTIPLNPWFTDDDVESIVGLIKGASKIGR